MRRSPALLVLALAVASLVACKQAAPDSAVAPAPEAAPAAQEPAATAPPATATTTPDDAAPAPTVDTQAGFAGYGDMKLGSTAEEAKTAWAGELNGKAGEGTTCYYLTPKWVKKPSDFAFMIEEGKFVRYDVGTDKEAAPGGGKVGMSTDELQKLYANTLQSAPHKYVEGGRTLSAAATDGSAGKLVFETDAAGKVTRWRVGLPPQVDYVEGCS